MYEYMRALHKTFFKEPECTELRECIQNLHRELSAQMEKESRKQLLRLVDSAEELSSKISLESFVAGFRLAAGLSAELEQKGAYSFDDEEEQRARKLRQS